MKKTQKPLALAKETITHLSDEALRSAGGGAPTTTGETMRCSIVQGTCKTCGATNCH